MVAWLATDSTHSYYILYARSPPLHRLRESPQTIRQAVAHQKTLFLKPQASTTRRPPHRTGHNANAGRIGSSTILAFYTYCLFPSAFPGVE